MIHTLAVSGYRSLRNLVLPLGQLNLVTGANGTGKSSLYRALRLLGDAALNTVVASLAREGGLPSTLWAGPETIARSVRKGEFPVEGTPRQKTIGLKLGFAGDPYSYCIDLGYPPPAQTAFPLDPAIKRECIWHGGIYRRASVLVDRNNRLVQLAPGKTAQARRAGDSDQGTEFNRQHAGDDCRSAAGAGDAGGARVDSRMAFLRGISDRFCLAGSDSAGGHVYAGLEQRRAPICRRRSRRFACLAIARRCIARSRMLFLAAMLRWTSRAGRFEVQLRQHGLLRPLSASELSDGTLRYLLVDGGFADTAPAGVDGPE